VTLDLSRDAQNFLVGLQPKQFKQVGSRILALQKEPFPNDAKHLSGYPGYRRIDCGEYRVCYGVEDGIVRITVIGKRNDDDVYRRLSRKT
jgi:mRNA interferase RelE/StbE